MKLTLLFFTILFTHISIQSQVVWSNECDNNSDWTFSNTSSPILDWQITTAVNAAPLPAYQPLGFTSISNGFFIIDSDAAGASATQNARVEIASPIDLTNQNHILLTFENAAQSFTDKRAIEVSGDNGATWTEYVVSSDTNHILYATENPSTFSVDISAVAGGQSQVLIAFIYEGGNDHFWAIDDVKIIEKEANDLQLDQIYFGCKGNLGIPISYYYGFMYENDTTDFSAIVSNQGRNDLTNITAFLSINDGVVLRDTNSLGLLEVGQTDTIYFDKKLADLYLLNKININLLADTIETNYDNNSDSVQLGSYQSMDAARSPADGSDLNTGIFNYGNEFMAGVIYDNLQEYPLTSVHIKLSSLSQENSLIYAIIYKWDSLNDSYVFVETSSDYDLTSAQVSSSSFIQLWFDSRVDVFPEETYLVAIGTYGNGGAGNDIILATSGASEKGTAFFDDVYAGTGLREISLKPIINLDFWWESVEENSSITSISNFPNPVSSFTTIEFNNSQSEDFELQITDLQGKQVHIQNLGKRNPGKHLIEFDASQLPSGTYIYSIGNENGKAAKSMMVLK